MNTTQHLRTRFADLLAAHPVITDELLLTTLAQAHALYSNASPTAPAFIPFIHHGIRSMGTSPDTCYSFARINGAGRYLITGMIGNAQFADILAQGGLVGIEKSHGTTYGVLDFEDIPVNEDGSFAIVLSAMKPEDTDAYWWPLPEQVDHLWVRQVTSDWSKAVDATLSITNLEPGVTHDQGPESEDPCGDFVENYLRAWCGHIEAMRSRGLTNALELSALPDATGKVNQSYYQGLFELQQDEVLVLEVAVPKEVRYWMVQVTDLSYTTPDWFAHPCSLNASQAVLDDDGILRVVVSPRDPGYYNWIDTAGLTQGSILGRWNRASENPLPQLRIVRQGELATQLPSSRRLTPDERAELIRARSLAAQSRRRA